MWSNAMVIQPNPSTSPILTDQFNSLCEALSIDTSSNATPESKLAALRKVPSDQLVGTISKLKMHTFRTSTDDSFLSKNYLNTLHDGTFAAMLAKHGVRLVVGEVGDEALLYKLVNPPSTCEGLVSQLRNYYPKPIVDKLLTLTDVYDIPDSKKDDANSQETKERYEDVFANMVADMQVHVAIRGLAKCLAVDAGSRSPEVMRYRIEWRAKALDGWLMPKVRVCHGADTSIWWMSSWRTGQTEKDNQNALTFLKSFGHFLDGKDLGVKAATVSRIAKRLDSEGQTHDDVEDELWERSMRIWEAVEEASKATT